MLETNKAQIDSFERAWKENTQRCMMAYRDAIEDIFASCEEAPRCMYSQVYLKQKASEWFQNAVLGIILPTFDWSWIKSVDFVINDDEENSRSVSIDFSENIWMCAGAISQGYDDLESHKENEFEEYLAIVLACTLYEYDDRILKNELIEKYSVRSEYNKAYNILNLIDNDLKNEIDRLTR